MILHPLPTHARPRRGVVAALVAVSLVALLAALALTADGGLLMAERRYAQAVADAAALSAAADLFDYWPINEGSDTGGTAAASALRTAADNGYTNDGTTSAVSVRGPGANYDAGPNAGAAIPPGRVEVLTTYFLPRYFSALFGSGTLSVGARSVAQGSWIPPAPQIIVFDLSGASTLAVVNNTGSITCTNGPVVVNSSDGSAASNPTTATFSAPEFRIAGGYSGNFSGTMRTGSPPVPDPLAYLPPPGGLPVRSNTALNYGDANPPPGPLQPGVYRGGIVVGGDVSLTLSPGIYYIQGGGFTFISRGNLTGNGVMIYNDPGNSGLQAVTLASPVPTGTPAPAPGRIALSPLTTGPYQGITIFQKQSAAAQVTLTGNGNYDITGTLYCANATMQIECKQYSGHNDVIGSQYMCRRLRLLGNSALVLSLPPQPARTRLIGLGE